MAHKGPSHPEILSRLLVHFLISILSIVFPTENFYHNITLEIVAQPTADFTGMDSFNSNNTKKSGMRREGERYKNVIRWLYLRSLQP